MRDQEAAQSNSGKIEGWEGVWKFRLQERRKGGRLDRNRDKRLESKKELGEMKGGKGERIWIKIQISNLVLIFFRGRVECLMLIFLLLPLFPPERPSQPNHVKNSFPPGKIMPFDNTASLPS